MIEIQSEYQGGLRVQATHGPSGRTLITDAPVDNHGKGESFSPTDLMATALGTCILTVMGIVAERNGINLTGARTTVQKIMSTDPPRRIVQLPVRVAMPAGINAEDRKKLEHTAHVCPVHKSIREDIDSPIEFTYPD